MSGEYFLQNLLILSSPRRLKRRQTFVMSATLTMDIAPPKRLQNKKKKVVVDNKLSECFLSNEFDDVYVVMVV